MGFLFSSVASRPPRASASGSAAPPVTPQLISHSSSATFHRTHNSSHTNSSHKIHHTQSPLNYSSDTLTHISHHSPHTNSPHNIHHTQTHHNHIHLAQTPHTKRLLVEWLVQYTEPPQGAAARVVLLFARLAWQVQYTELPEGSARGRLVGAAGGCVAGALHRGSGKELLRAWPPLILQHSSTRLITHHSSHATHRATFITQPVISHNSSLTSHPSPRSSHTTPLKPLITQPLITHRSSHTTHPTAHPIQLISHQSSHTIHLTRLI